MPTINHLLETHCTHQETALTASEIADYLLLMPGWVLQDGKIRHSFDFKDYKETMAFVNAVAAIADAEDHHPELTVTYNRCILKFDTHSVHGGSGGISENDFICAAKVAALHHKMHHGAQA
jgi:4a-hydroxytetrahydrobiopterin dehydratase